MFDRARCDPEIVVRTRADSYAVGLSAIHVTIAPLRVDHEMSSLAFAGCHDVRCSSGDGPQVCAGPRLTRAKDGLGALNNS